MTREEKKQLLKKHTDVSLSCKLFCKHPENYQFNPNRKFEIDSLDDESEYFSYSYFLDNVQNKEDLVLGLTELRPFADDALEVARQMTDHDFAKFKLELICERRGEKSKMPAAYRIIVLPVQILQATFLAGKAGAPVGTVLVRMLETELGV